MGRMPEAIVTIAASPQFKNADKVDRKIKNE